MALKPFIAEVINGRSLSFVQAQEAMTLIMNGEATQAQIGSYLTALRMKGETADEVAGSAAAMRSLVVPVNIKDRDKMVMDVVGTGGDGRNTFNISTTTAFVVAGHGVQVAKHGNRAASSKSGSADVLMALGANLDLSAGQVGECIDDVGIGFMYAVKHHPAMRHAIGPRRELGQRTIFNILGPLSNPASADHYLLGVFSPHLTEQMAIALRELGTQAAFVVHGADGLDELSITGVNKISRLKNGEVDTMSLDPVTLGFGRATLADIAGGTPEENAAITRNILNGRDKGPRREIVLLNAAAALSVSGHDLEAGLAKAKESIDSGAALQKLEKWVEKTNSY
ncbi:MAG: anthranilate phosphoribosyltransferase [Ardenticatenaceae bacterium]|nr:anthranilate phosphoribosyltransferase [Ardenticatenaceae bacterium]